MSGFDRSAFCPRGGRKDEALVMGIVNVTPDSFSDGGRYAAHDAAIAHGLRLIEEGADILDIGGESTRPGARPVPEAEEIARVRPVIEALAPACREAGLGLSIDTRHAAVMAAGLAAGATILNDVTALGTPEKLRLAAEARCGVVLMHMQGEPQTMQANPFYGDVVAEVTAWLLDRAARAVAAGVSADHLVLDPGIGFGKDVTHNLALLAATRHLADAAASRGHGLLVGLSRKSFIGKVSRGEGVDDRLPGSLAGALAAWRGDADILRVHDVAATRQALAVAAGIRAHEL